MKNAEELGLSAAVANMLAGRLDEIKRELGGLVTRREFDTLTEQVKGMMPRGEAALMNQMQSEKIDAVQNSVADMRGALTVNHGENVQRFEEIKKTQAEQAANRLPKWMWPVVATVCSTVAPIVAVILAHYIK